MGNWGGGAHQKGMGEESDPSPTHSLAWRAGLLQQKPGGLRFLPVQENDLAPHDLIAGDDAVEVDAARYRLARLVPSVPGDAPRSGGYDLVDQSSHSLTAHVVDGEVDVPLLRKLQQERGAATGSAPGNLGHTQARDDRSAVVLRGACADHIGQS